VQKTPLISLSNTTNKYIVASTQKRKLMGLKQTNQALSDINYQGNFISTPIKLGDIFFLDDHDYTWMGNILDEFNITDTSKIIRAGNPQDLEFSKKTGVDLDFGATGSNSKVGEGEVALTFTRKNSVLVTLKNAVSSEIAMESIRDEMIEYWKKKGYNKKIRKYIVASELVTAESGIMIFSQDKNSSITLKADADIPVANVGDIASGNFSISGDTSETLNVTSTSSFNPLFKAVRLRRNDQLESI
jgi:hypothetical protein